MSRNGNQVQDLMVLCCKTSRKPILSRFQAGHLEYAERGLCGFKAASSLNVMCLLAHLANSTFVSAI